MRLALYLRVSTAEQSEDGTIQTQRDELERFCEVHGHGIVAEFPDDGVSGSIPFDEREQGKALLAFVRCGGCDGVLVYKLDRLGRDAYDILATGAYLKAHSVQLLSATQELGGNGSAAGLTSGLLAVIAQYEREVIRERSMAGVDRIVREGRWPGTRVPYGYRVENTNKCSLLFPDDTPVPALGITRQELVRWIYRWIADDRLSLVAVAKRLNDIGVPAPHGMTWHPATIGGIVHNTTYRGEFRFQRRGSHEACIVCVPRLVSDELWHQANAVITANQRRLAGHTDRELLCAGLIQCAHCGSAYCGSQSGGRRRPYSYYRCIHNQRHRQLGVPYARCPSVQVPQEWLDGEVWSDIAWFLLHPEETLQELQQQNRQTEDRAEKRRAELGLVQSALAANDEERRIAIDLCTRRIITDTDLVEKLARIAEAREGLETQAEEITANLRQEATWDTSKREAERALRSWEKPKARGEDWSEGWAYAEKRELALTMVRCIVVETDTVTGRVSATAHYQFGEEASRRHTREGRGCAQAFRLATPYVKGHAHLGRVHVWLGKRVAA